MDNGGAAAGIGGLMLIAILGGLYFLPSIVAGVRHHHQLASIVLLNLFLGWTFVGWVVALVMAASAKRDPIAVAHYYGGHAPPPAPYGYPPPQQGYPPQQGWPQSQPPQPPPPPPPSQSWEPPPTG